MKYILKKALEDNIEYLIECKLNNILEYADELSKEEINRIKDYVNKTIPHQIENYKIIIIDNKIAGCVLVEAKNEGFLLDEIYIKADFRNKGIGAEIIKNILIDKKIVYLWVYKLNEKAIKLYKKLGFEILEETDTRYYMKNKLKK
ncbi:MAG: GNAT family N-acetyltransferase [Bacilli bacterium]|nr:GNAT family N-acetyltransferase [Bacilli bacterium]